MAPALNERIGSEPGDVSPADREVDFLPGLEILSSLGWNQLLHERSHCRSIKDFPIKRT
jgi:hypothetical protein